MSGVMGTDAGECGGAAPAGHGAFTGMPVYGWAGLAVVVVVWPLNWALSGLRTHVLFFPLWLGFALAMAGLAAARGGRSPVTAGWRAYGMLFVLSAPAWWLFEAINLRTQNWSYLGRGEFSDLEYAAWATVSFSTVIPAVFGGVSLAGTFAWTQRMRAGPRIPAGTKGLVAYLACGLGMLSLLLLWPRFFYPLVWLSVFFILDPVSALIGKRSLLRELGRGDWSTAGRLWAGVMICGLAWELWNWRSYPKWVYDVPFLGFGHVFEMPVLGYLGYLPFALELFALYHLAAPRRPPLRV